MKTQKCNDIEGKPALLQADPVLEVKNLSKIFTGVKVLDQISFTLHSGEAVALVGHNGSGKSTLLRCISSLIELSSGKVLFDSRIVGNLSSGNLRRVRSKIGFVFQKHNLVSRLSVLSNVIHGGLAQHISPRYWLQGLAPAAARKKALAALAEVGMAEHAHKRVSQLSGGQSQRVAIARTLMQDPKIILADEPVASLDPQAASDVMELLFRLNQDRDLTVLFTTHHLEHAFEYANRIIALKAGKLVFDQQTTEISQAEVQKIYG